MIDHGEQSGPTAAPAATHSPALAPATARAYALEAGFTEAGLVALPHVNEERDASRFAAWIRAGRAGSMRYLERTSEDGRLTRERVQIPFPWARSALVCFASYLAPEAAFSTDAQERDDATGQAWIARYARTSRWQAGRDGAQGEHRPSDYHKVLLKRLRLVEARLHERFGDFSSRAYVDTGPIVERALAVAAGLGWTGKNTCLIHPRLGSFGFLAVLVTSLEAGQAEERIAAAELARGGDWKQHGLRRTAIEAEQSGISAPKGDLLPASLEIPNRCGSCRRCIDACPTHALDTPYRMDATRCIAYLTIEHKGPIAEDLLPLVGRQVFGCDICQDVCPWNGKARSSGSVPADPELTLRPELDHPALTWLGTLDESAFAQLFNGSPVRRAGLRGLQRNVAIAMGNSGLAAFAQRLAEWAEAADEGVRSAARWALERLRTRNDLRG